MMVGHHLLSALPLAVGSGLVGGSWALGITAGAAAVLVDADHVLDYLLSNGRFQGFGHLFRFCRAGRLKYIPLVAHSYELWLAGLFLLPGLAPPWLAQGILIGWLYHLLLDQLFNPAKPWVYFFGYRLALGFDKSKVQTPDRNLYTDLALKLGLPRPPWTRPEAKGPQA